MNTIDANDVEHDPLSLAFDRSGDRGCLLTYRAKERLKNAAQISRNQDKAQRLRISLAQAERQLDGEIHAEESRETQTYLQYGGRIYTRFFRLAKADCRVAIGGSARAAKLAHMPEFQLFEILYRHWRRADYGSFRIAVKEMAKSVHAARGGTSGKKKSISVRQTQRLLRQLKVKGLLIAIDGGNKRSAYEICLPEGPDCNAIWSDMTMVTWLAINGTLDLNKSIDT